MAYKPEVRRGILHQGLGLFQILEALENYNNTLLPTIAATTCGIYVAPAMPTFRDRIRLSRGSNSLIGADDLFI